MQKAPTELYACGSRVQVPSLYVSFTKGRSTGPVCGLGVTGPGSSPAFFSPPLQRKLHHNRHFSDGVLDTKQQISELGAQLCFEEDVVLSQCPEAVTYSEARRRLGQLCRSEGLPLRAGRSKGDGFSVETGRHDMRGTLKKHRPCRIHSPSPPSVPRRAGKLRLPPLKASSIITSFSSEAGLKSEPGSHDTLRGVWEEAMLFGVCSSTARLFMSTARGKDRERLSELLQKKEERELGVMQEFPTPGVSSPSVSEGEDERLDVCLEEKLPVTSRDFLAELQQGVTPVHQQGGGKTIVLSNDARFEKVLQSSYPQPPQEWLKEGREEGRRSERQLQRHPRVKAVRGYQRWIALPERAKVSPLIFLECLYMYS